MNGFIFRLERLFQLRAKLERQRAQDLARAVEDERERRATLDAAAARLDRCGQQVAESTSTISAGALRNLGITVEAAARRVEDAHGEHQAALDSVETQREQFGEARKERRIVERLRERRREAWDVEQGRKEQKELDGVSAQRHAQKNLDGQRGTQTELDGPSSPRAQEEPKP